MNDSVHLLVIDDERNYLLVLETLLAEAGYTVTALNDPETALAFLEESEVDVVITDMKMPKVTGREVLERVKKNWPHIPVLIMTAFGSIEGAVEAMRYGAFNYITKPFSNDELLLSIQNAAELARAHRQYQILRESLEERYGKHQIIGRSRVIRNMLDLVDRAAPSRATVLITGESGTGKELVARAIHFSSPRLLFRSTAWLSTPAFSKANSSDMKRDRLQAPSPCVAGALNRLTEARSFLTKWGNSPRNFR